MYCLLGTVCVYVCVLGEGEVIVHKDMFDVVMLFLTTVSMPVIAGLIAMGLEIGCFAPFALFLHMLRSVGIILCILCTFCGYHSIFFFLFAIFV